MSLDVRDDMERGLLLSRGSVPTGGRCCGRLLYQSSPGVDGEAMEAGEPREGSEPWSDPATPGVAGEVTE